LDSGDEKNFEIILTTLLAQIPSNLIIGEERFFHSLFIMIMYLTGIGIESEVNTNTGRIDGVIEFSDKIYIVEFKYNLLPEEGLKQILKKKYYEKYLNRSKPLILLGVGFSRESVKTAFLKYEGWGLRDEG